jgi:hypothetical protein
MVATGYRTLFLRMLVYVFAAALSTRTGLLIGAQAQTPMRAQAQRAVQRPMKLDVRPLSAVAHAGDKVQVAVTMLDANNEQASWNRESQVEVNVTGPSGAPQEYKATLQPGQSAVQLTINASEAGLLTLRAREANDTLLPGGNSLFVTRPTTRTAHKLKRNKQRSVFVTGSGRFLTIAARFSQFPIPIALSQTGDGQGGGSTTVASSPELMVVNSSGKDEILADGRDFARIGVYYVDPQGGPAASDIKIWLTWSNGNLSPQPLIIKKGDTGAEAQWTSLSAVDATVSVVVSAPNYAVAGNRELHVSFVPPIYGIAPSNPSPLKLSLIDYEPVVTQFFDREGHTVQTSRLRHVTFISSNPSLHVEPASFDVPANGSGATIYLVPTWSGNSKLDIWTPGYDHQTLEIETTMWLVLLLCLSGGVVGGIAARDALKGGVVWRVFVGILGSIVLVWICVYAVLPQTSSIIAHNLVSVFVVGIVGGYGGTRVLDFAGKKLGYL